MRANCGAFSIGPVFGGTSGVATVPASHVPSRVTPVQPVVTPERPETWDEKVARYLQSKRA